MKCHECEELLQQRMDDDANVSSPALEQHLTECAACREQHQAAVRLLEGLKQIQAPKPGLDFAASLTAKVLHDRRHRQEKMRRRVVLTFALAASVMFLLALAYFWIPRTPTVVPQPKQDFVQKSNEVPREAPAPKKQDEVKPAPKEEPRNPLAALPERMEETTRDYAQVVLAAAKLDEVNKLPLRNLPELDPGMREAGQEVSDGVRVVSRNASRAFGFLVREMPIPEFGAKGD